MNYLGHLYFSNDDAQLKYANLIGDYIKGSNISHYPTLIQEGVKLHRAIDNYIDTHPLVKDLLKELYEPLPKISGVAIDLYFDHLLAKAWSHYHQTDLKQFANDFYETQFSEPQVVPSDFKFMFQKMKEMDWLSNYRHLEGLEFACRGLSQRISFDNVLWKAPEVFQEKEARITQTFEAFMDQAKEYFTAYFQDNR